MKYVLTAAQMKNADSDTITQFGISQPVLMERAALSVCDEIAMRFPVKKSRICIVCGNGNNGGDGYAIGRILTEWGYPTDIFCANPSGRCSDGNKLQADILKKMEIAVRTDIPADEYDIIIGNVADDDVFKTVDMYFRGLWDKKKVLEELRYYKMNNQICIVNQEALNRLITFKSAYEVENNGK